MKKKLLCLLLALLLAGAPAALAGDEAPESAGETETPAAEAPAGPDEALDIPDTDGAEPYTVWVAGRQITSGNRFDVTGDGSVRFDPGTMTLTLTGGDSDKWGSGRKEEAIIYAWGVDLTVTGDGTIIAYGSDNAIRVDEGSLTLDGDLELTSFENTVFVPDGSVLLRGGTVTVMSHSAANTGILCYGAVSMTGGSAKVCGGYHGIYTNFFYMNGGRIFASGADREGIHAGTDIVISGGEVTAEGGSWGIFAYGYVEIGNGAARLDATGGECAILADTGLTLGNMLTVSPAGARVGSDGRSITGADGVTALGKVVISQEPETTLTLSISDDGKSAKISGGFVGLFARVALILDNNGQSGLYVTQATINPDGTILIPVFMVPGLTVKGVNVALVPTLADIQSATPKTVTSAFRMLP